MNEVPARSRKSEQGTSLFEVTLAMGLLGLVLGSVAGLFTIGATQVKSGRNATEALGVARSVVAEVHGLGFDQIYGVFGEDGTQSSYTIDTGTNTFAHKWQDMLDACLPASHAEIFIEALEPSTNVKDSSQIRVTVTVYWEEGPRKREVRLGLVRM